jgi:tmRNA-binding protein
MPAKMVALSEISSIREEREQFLDQGIDQNSDGVSVFNKILQDYKIYKHKKVDPKKLKKLKMKDEY